MSPDAAVSTGSPAESIVREARPPGPPPARRRPNAPPWVWGVAAIGPAVLGPAWWYLLGRHLGWEWGTQVGFVLVVTVAISAVTDVLWRKIYNAVVVPAALWGVAVHGVGALLADGPATGPFTFAPPIRVGPEMLGAIGLGQSVAGLMLGFAIVFVAYVLSRGGAGDVKLAAAIGALLGLRWGVVAIAIAYIAAAVYGLALILVRHGAWAGGRAFARHLLMLVLPNVRPTEQDRAMMTQKMALGPFFAVGVAAVLAGVDEAL